MSRVHEHRNGLVSIAVLSGFVLSSQAQVFTNRSDFEDFIDGVDGPSRLSSFESSPLTSGSVESVGGGGFRIESGDDRVLSIRTGNTSGATATDGVRYVYIDANTGGVELDINFIDPTRAVGIDIVDFGESDGSLTYVTDTGLTGTAVPTGLDNGEVRFFGLAVPINERFSRLTLSHTNSNEAFGIDNVFYPQPILVYEEFGVLTRPGMPVRIRPNPLTQTLSIAVWGSEGDIVWSRSFGLFSPFEPVYRSFPAGDYVVGVAPGSNAQRPGFRMFPISTPEPFFGLQLDERGILRDSAIQGDAAYASFTVSPETDPVLRSGPVLSAKLGSIGGPGTYALDISQASFGLYDALTAELLDDGPVGFDTELGPLAEGNYILGLHRSPFVFSTGFETGFYDGKGSFEAGPLSGTLGDTEIPRRTVEVGGTRWLSFSIGPDTESLDVNGDGFIDFFDVLEFLTRFDELP